MEGEDTGTRVCGWFGGGAEVDGGGAAGDRWCLLSVAGCLASPDFFLGFLDFLRSPGFVLRCFGGLAGLVAFDFFAELLGEGLAGLSSSGAS